MEGGFWEKGLENPDSMGCRDIIFTNVLLSDLDYGISQTTKLSLRYRQREDNQKAK